MQLLKTEILHFPHLLINFDGYGSLSAYEKVLIPCHRMFQHCVLCWFWPKYYIALDAYESFCAERSGRRGQSQFSIESAKVSRCSCLQSFL